MVVGVVPLHNGVKLPVGQGGAVSQDATRRAVGQLLLDVQGYTDELRKGTGCRFYICVVGDAFG